MHRFRICTPSASTLVWMTNPQQGFDRDIVSYPMFRDWRDQSREVFESMAVYSAQSANILAGASPEEVRMGGRSRRSFSTLSVSPTGLVGPSMPAITSRDAIG